MGIPIDPRKSDLSARQALFALDRASDATYWILPDGHLTYANEAASRMSGFTRDELLSMTVFDILTNVTPAIWSRIWEEAKSHKSFQLDLSHRSRKGHDLSVEISVNYLEVEGEGSLCAYVRDINERQRLKQLKDDFVGMVSHELRTPTTIIYESISQILEGLRGAITPEQQQALSIAARGTRRLMHLINDLLDLSKIEAGRMTLKKEPCDLNAVIKEACLPFSPRAKERNIELALDLPDQSPDTLLDRNRMIQVLTNLLANAFKFTEKGSIKVIVRDHGDEVECRISDTGRGIAPERLANVFEKFADLGVAAVTSEKGTGLGLSICKGIIELHKGRIGVESEPAYGTTVYFNIPKLDREALFKDQVHEIYQEAQSKGAAMSIIFFQINNLEALRSEHGQMPVARAMDRLEHLLRTDFFRKSDIMGRYADMFYLILYSTVKREAVRLVTRVTQTLKDSLSKDGLDSAFDLDFHVACYPEDVATEEALLERTSVKQLRHAA